MGANKILELLQFLSIISLGPILACLAYLGSEKMPGKVSLSLVIYSYIYGAVGCALSVLLIENLVSVLYEVTSVGYFRVMVQGRGILLFTPTLFFFPFVEESLKVMGVARLLSSGEKNEKQAVVLGFFSGIGFSSSINLVKATVFFTKNELATWFLSQILESFSHIMVHAGTTGLLSYFLNRMIRGESSIPSLLGAYVVLVLVHVVYRLILALRGMAGLYIEVCLVAFAVLFSVMLVVFLRKKGL